MQDYKIYIHRNKINNKAYIGQTINPKERWKPKNYKNNPHFYAAIEKYGWDSFEHIIFASGLTLEEANHMERLMIALFDTTNQSLGYNIRSGGDSGGAFSEEARKRMSEAQKGLQAGAKNGRARKVAQYDLQDNFIKEWDCIKEAADALGICRQGINACCTGKRKTAGGYKWRCVNGLLG